MLAKSLMLALATGASAEFLRCATTEPPVENLVDNAVFASQEAKARQGLARYPEDPIVVPTVFHVIAISEREEDGYLSDDTLQKQLDVLNADYSEWKISFDLVNTTKRVHQSWAYDREPIPMRRELRQGGYETLNIYYLTSAQGYLGYCTYPLHAEEGSDSFFRDGCVVLSASAPGMDFEPYNLGRTATHEVGHWMDLAHTFQGGCGCVGDMIHDTPPSANASFGCPVGRNTCPDRWGVDPIHNFMDYTDDACMNEFTAGQAAWNTYRI